VAASLGAVLLDACLPGLLGPVRAAEATAALGLLLAWRMRRGEGASAWSTPIAARLAGALAVLLLATVPWRDGLAGLSALRPVLAGSAMFYALAALAGCDALALDVVWGAFPLVTALLGLHALWAATPGLAHLGAAALAADARWNAPHALDTPLLVATVLTIGRAAEPRARPVWRLAAIVGVAGLGLHVAASGPPFSAAALSRLEDPLRFSTTMVVALVLQRLASVAWTLRHERPAEAGRWWGAVAAVGALGTELLYGSGTPGSGLATVAALMAAVVVTAPTVPAAVPAALPEAPAAPFARAA